jgi:hypothetical protein
VQITAKIEDGVTNVFAMAGQFDRAATVDDDDNIVADLSTVIEADEVVCYNSSVTGDNVPVVEEYTGTNRYSYYYYRSAYSHSSGK